MNNVFTAKLLNNLRNKKGDKGFTLIELLVVVIIIGVLAAIALPNLLGQVGKARESEGKNITGALNRAQQARFVERGSFAGNTTATPDAITVAEADRDADGKILGTNYISLLEVPTGAAKYYTFGVPAEAIQLARGNNNQDNGTRDFVGAVQYDQNTRDFQTLVCRSMVGPDYNAAVNLETARTAFTTDGEGVIASGADEVRISCLTAVAEEAK